MKAISIKQPYAWAICAGYKDVENRSWPTKYRGPILIHAGKKELKNEIDKVLWEIVSLSEGYFRGVVKQYQTEMALGSIIGYAEIIDCVTEYDSPWFTGPYGFVLKNARLSDPVPYKGQLGFFGVPDIDLRFKKAALNAGKETK